VSTLSMRLATPAGQVAIVAARLVVAGVFLWAGLPKLLDPATFAEDISNYNLLPESTVGYAAVVVPVVEIVIALALIAGVEVKGAALVAAAMLVVFVAAMGQAMARGIDLSCGCVAGTTETEVGWGPIVRNAGLLAACALVLVGPEVRWRALGREPRDPRGQEPSP